MFSGFLPLSGLRVRNLIFPRNTPSGAEQLPARRGSREKMQNWPQNSADNIYRHSVSTKEEGITLRLRRRHAARKRRCLTPLNFCCTKKGRYLTPLHFCCTKVSWLSFKGKLHLKSIFWVSNTTEAENHKSKYFVKYHYLEIKDNNRIILRYFSYFYLFSWYFASLSRQHFHVWEAGTIKCFYMKNDLKSYQNSW